MRSESGDCSILKSGTGFSSTAKDLPVSTCWLRLRHKRCESTESGLLVPSYPPPIHLLKLRHLVRAVIVIPMFPGVGIGGLVLAGNFCQSQESPVTHLGRGLGILRQCNK